MRKVAYKDPLSRSRMSTVGIQQVEASLEVIFSCYILQSNSSHKQYHLIMSDLLEFSRGQEKSQPLIIR